MKPVDGDPELKGLRELIEPLSRQRVSSDEAESWVKAAISRKIPESAAATSGRKRALVASLVAAGLGFGLGAWWFGSLESQDMTASQFASAVPESSEETRESSRPRQDRSAEIIRVVLE